MWVGQILFSSNLLPKGRGRSSSPVNSFRGKAKMLTGDLQTLDGPAHLHTTSLAPFPSSLCSSHTRLPGLSQAHQALLPPGHCTCYLLCSLHSSPQKATWLTLSSPLGLYSSVTFSGISFLTAIDKNSTPSFHIPLNLSYLSPQHFITTCHCMYLLVVSPSPKLYNDRVYFVWFTAIFPALRLMPGT